MEVCTINKYKKRTYSQLHKRAKFYFNKFIRLRDTDDNGYGTCISSGQSLRYGTENAQAGHYIAGTCRVLEFNEDNVNLQGKSDNYFKSGNQTAYRINLVKKIGAEKVADLEDMFLISKRNVSKNDRFLMIEIIEKYKVKVKQLSKNKVGNVFDVV